MKILNWLSPIAGESEIKQRNTFNLEGRQDGMGNWILETQEFKDWLNGSATTLWCSGMRMCSLPLRYRCIS